MADGSTWLSIALGLIVAAIPAVVAWRAAILARRSADDARASEEESARLERLEARVSAQKYEMYSPLITLLGDVLRPGANVDEDQLGGGFTKFQTWAAVYASDGALNGFGRLMQGAFNAAPPNVLLRLYADFVLEARKDMGDEKTLATIEDVLAPRIKDLYSDEAMQRLSLPFDDLCRVESWVAPWSAIRPTGALETGG